MNVSKAPRLGTLPYVTMVRIRSFPPSAIMAHSSRIGRSMKSIAFHHTLR